MGWIVRDGIEIEDLEVKFNEVDEAVENKQRLDVSGKVIGVAEGTKVQVKILRTEKTKEVELTRDVKLSKDGSFDIEYSEDELKDLNGDYTLDIIIEEEQIELAKINFNSKNPKESTATVTYKKN